MKFVMMRYDTTWGVLTHRYSLAWHGEVPACGYAAFDLRLESGGLAGAAGSNATSTTSNHQLENSHVRLTVNADDTVDVQDKKTGTRYARCGDLEDV